MQIKSTLYEYTGKIRVMTTMLIQRRLYNIYVHLTTLNDSFSDFLFRNRVMSPARIEHTPLKIEQRI